MRLTLVVALNGGGSVTVTGDDLSPEAIHEVFTMLAAHPVTSAEATLPPPHPQAWFDAEADRIWGPGNWVVCEQCPPDDEGHPVRHHVDAHR